MGALSLNGEEIFREGFGPLLPNCAAVPFNDLEALERELSSKDVAAFIVEPIQGKGVNVPSDNYLPEVERLCKKYGALLVADEVQTGLGRTGKFWAVEHWGVEPDMICMAKALSGGFVPVGAVAMTQHIMDTVYKPMGLEDAARKRLENNPYFRPEGGDWPTHAELMVFNSDSAGHGTGGFARRQAPGQKLHP
jgi:ornithine--oxo-acid transaminase